MERRRCRCIYFRAQQNVAIVIKADQALIKGQVEVRGQKQSIELIKSLGMVR